MNALSSDAVRESRAEARGRRVIRQDASAPPRLRASFFISGLVLVTHVVFLGSHSTAHAQSNSLGLDSFAKWAKIEIQLTGPHAAGSSEPNPFAIKIDGVFTASSGKSITVPGFYDGDGRGEVSSCT